MAVEQDFDSADPACGVCPECHRERPVAADGLLKAHRRFLALWRGERVDAMVQCFGSGQRPVRMIDAS